MAGVWGGVACEWVWLFRVLYTPWRMARSAISAFTLGVYVRSVPNCNTPTNIYYGYAQLTILLLVFGTDLVLIFVVKPFWNVVRARVAGTASVADFLTIVCAFILAMGVVGAGYAMLACQAVALSSHLIWIVWNAYDKVILGGKGRGVWESMLALAGASYAPTPQSPAQKEELITRKNSENTMQNNNHVQVNMNPIFAARQMQMNLHSPMMQEKLMNHHRNTQARNRGNGISIFDYGREREDNAPPVVEMFKFEKYATATCMELPILHEGSPPSDDFSRRCGSL
ncbi:hypothetical protein CYMTET_53028 [Cymbomonas tetramitiformis]|uniref:Uncharacterized protein n=1 Tax=Cymbomonas tetramitiformis TaxID=36881 RepID=A0AAE0ER10_9CHLO|nr:hypothetical protein CYMTET_53028 [Cymbomonas tetramitiformis]